MLIEYTQAAMRHAKYEILSDDKSYYGEIPDFGGVYANAPTLEECRRQLEEVLEEWVLLHVFNKQLLPVVDGIELKVRHVA